MEVYIECIYFINGFILIIVFEMLALLLNIHFSLKQIVLYSWLCNISMIMMYIDMYPWVCLMIWMIIFLFIFKKQFFIYYPTFLILYFSNLFFLQSLIIDSFIYNGILITPVNYVDMTLLVVACFFSVMQLVYWMYSKKKIQHDDYIYPLVISYQNKDIHCHGFLDSGNDVYYQGYPLILINQSLLKDYQVIDKIIIDKPVVIEIDIICLDSLICNHQTMNHVYAGVIRHIQYDCLLNKQLMGGIL